MSFQDYPVPEQIAAHEAGHAVVAMVESGFESIPDWVSIIPSKNMAGVMVQDYRHIYSAGLLRSFSQVRTAIRIDLAGRVAEELLLGELNVGADCANSDLKEASWKALNLMARNGFSSTYGVESNKGSNLLVMVPRGVEIDSKRFHEEARRFIQTQYLAVKLTLNQNMPLLKSIQEGLIANKLLLKGDLSDLMHEILGANLKAVA